MSKSQKVSLDAQNWPEGHHIRKAIHNQLPDNFGHSEWAWRSNGYPEKPESVGSKMNKAESRRCLGVLQCQDCERLVRPNTKTDDMRAQVARGCPGNKCGGELVQITCEARCYLWVVEEGGVRYSIWEHTGSHRSHPHPPVGRKPPCSRKVTAKAAGHIDAPGDQTNAKDQIAEPALPRQPTPPLAHPQADSNEAGTSHDHSGTPSRTRTPLAGSVRSAKVRIPSQLQPQQFPLPHRSDVKKLGPDLARALDCAGCGLSGDGSELDGEAMQCDSCKKWSHGICMQEPLELSLRGGDMGWTCPPCRGIEVWRDGR
jgi:hypothetical protein